MSKVSEDQLKLAKDFQTFLRVLRAFRKYSKVLEYQTERSLPMETLVLAFRSIDRAYLFQIALKMM